MIVSAAAVSLRPVQEINKKLDKQLNILQVAGLYQPGQDVAEAFKAFEPQVLDLQTGKFTDQFDAASFDDRAAAQDPELSRVAGPWTRRASAASRVTSHCLSAA